MSNKEFWELMDEVVRHCDFDEVWLDDFSKKYEEVKGKSLNEKVRPEITEKGMKILNWMSEHKEEYNNVFTAKNIGDGLQTTGRSVSGSMSKLIEKGYIELNETNAKHKLVITTEIYKSKIFRYYII